MSKVAKEQFLVLVADDSENDRFLLKAAMGQNGRLRVVNEVTDGSKVIAYLQGQGAFSDRKKFPLPDLLLLDLKMPLVTGFEVLKWLGAHSFRSLKVVVLTDSMDPSAIKQALDLGADLFQVKPAGKRDYEAMISALEEYMLAQFQAQPRLSPLTSVARAAKSQRSHATSVSD